MAILTYSLPTHEKTCCTPREHALLFAEIAAAAQYDAGLRRLLPYARTLLVEMAPC